MNQNLNVSMTKEEQDIVDFLLFESETAIIYPFAVPFDDLTMDAVSRISSICNKHTDTETIYAACEEVLGINPDLKMENWLWIVN